MPAPRNPCPDDGNDTRQTEMGTVSDVVEPFDVRVAVDEATTGVGVRRVRTTTSI
jgi:hypothetical protein